MLSVKSEYHSPASAGCFAVRAEVAELQAVSDWRSELTVDQLTIY